MAMTTRGTRGSSLLMSGAKKASAPAAKSEPLVPLFKGTKIEPGKSYRLPIKKGSRGKGTRLG